MREFHALHWRDSVASGFKTQQNQSLEQMIAIFDLDANSNYHQTPKLRRSLKHSFRIVETSDLFSLQTHFQENRCMSCIRLPGLRLRQKICFRLQFQSSRTFSGFKIITFILKRPSVFVNYLLCERRSGYQVPESVGWDTLHKSVSSGTDRRHYPLLTLCFCI